MKREKRPTIQDIAKQSGLSASTVSRVLSGQQEYKISEKTKAKVERVARKLGYVPNAMARGVRLSEPSKIVGVVVPTIHNTFYSAIVKSLEENLNLRGYSILLGSSQEDTYRENAVLELMQRRIVSALVVCPVGHRVEAINSLHRKGVPTVVMDRFHEDLECSFVGSDNESGAYAMTKHLLECGHRRIAVIPGLNTLPVTNERLTGIRNAYADMHVDIDEATLVGNEYSQSDGKLDTELLLERSDPPTAIFALNNLVSLGILEFIVQSGKYKVPEDVSLVSFDDEFFSPYLVVPMTTVRQNCDEMGKFAIKILMEAIDDPDGAPAKHKKRVKTELILRNSVKILA